MRDFLTMFTGDLVRMRKYGITGASLLVVIIWVVMLHYAGGGGNLGNVFGLVMFIDATMMSLLLVGVVMLFEKQEGAIKSLLVVPAGKATYLGAKTLAVMMSSIVTLALLLVYGLGFRDLSISIPGILGAVMLVSFVYCQLGIFVVYRVRDFTSLLMVMMAFFIPLALPTLLEFLGLIDAEWFRYVQYINPAKSALNVLVAPAMPVAARDLWLSLGALGALGAFLAWLGWRGFDAYAAREIGG